MSKNNNININNNLNSNKNLDNISETESKIFKYEHYNSLYGFYENLLTDKQREYFMNYYFYDLSLSEIAKNLNISRSAVFDAIEKIHKLLDEYEEKLMLFEKYQRREDIYTSLENINNDNVTKLVKYLRDID